jgi:Fe-S-cluster containining protein
MPSLNPAKGTEQKRKMTPEHIFTFRCHAGTSCFTQCCRDVTIVLTPYDILRLKKGLGISSEEFLDRYTLIFPQKGRLIPLVILRMNENDKKCVFVTEQGCSIYEDRPWPCRMYPLNMDDDGTFSQIAGADRCRGLAEEDVWRIGDWLSDQGIVPYEEMNALFSGITIPLKSQKMDIDNPQITKMLFMALYNIDKFREFVFNSTFLDRFYVEHPCIEKIRKNDEELLKFAFDLFGEKLFWVKEGALKEGTPKGK